MFCEKQKPVPIWGPVFVLLILLIFLVARPGETCALEDFIPAEFTDRCRHMQQSIDTAHMAARMETPTAPEYIDKVMAEWVDFQLDHGAAPPPLFQSVATDTWASVTWRIGRSIAAASRNQWNPADLEEAKLILLQMSEPSRIEKNRDLLASWSLALMKEPGDDPNRFVMWMEGVCRSPMLELRRSLGSFPLLAGRPEKWLQRADDDLRLLNQAVPEMRSEVIRSLVIQWRPRLMLEMTFWREILLW